MLSRRGSERCSFSSNITCGICSMNGRLSGARRKGLSERGSVRSPSESNLATASGKRLVQPCREEGFRMEDVPSLGRHGEMVVVSRAMWLRHEN